MSKVVQHLCVTFGVKTTFSSSFKASTNGKIERFHRTLLGILRTHPSAQSNWPALIPAILLGLRSTPSNNSTLYSPHELLFGRKMHTPTLSQFVPPPETHEQPVQQYYDELQDKLHAWQETARQNNAIAKEKFKFQHDKSRTRYPAFTVGQKVLMSRDFCLPTQTRKMLTPYLGPLEIIDINHDYLTCRLKNVQTGKLLPVRVHCSKLRIFHEPSPSTQTSKTTPPSTQPPTSPSPSPVATESAMPRRSSRFHSPVNYRQLATHGLNKPNQTITQPLPNFYANLPAPGRPIAGTNKPHMVKHLILRIIAKRHRQSREQKLCVLQNFAHPKWIDSSQIVS